jgi:hypothetical protein
MSEDVYRLSIYLGGVHSAFLQTFAFNHDEHGTFLLRNLRHQTVAI